jgi:hypothetical protein
MERFAGTDYSVAMLQFSRFLRQELWNENNARILYAVLNTLNTVFDLLHEELPYLDYESIDFYIKQFIRAWVKYRPFYPSTGQWDNIEREVHELLTGVIIKKQWDILNPYIDTDDNENFEKGFLSIFDDMFKRSIVHNEHIFTRDYNSIKHMHRGAKGKHDYTRLLPNPSYAALNRWNPKGRCFVYAALEDNEHIFDTKNDILHGEMVCLEELRTENGDEITLCELELISGIANKKVFDFSYNDISLSDIEAQTVAEQQLLTQEIIKNIQTQMNCNHVKDATSLKMAITKEIDKRHNDTLSLVGRYAARTLLKMICDNIYIVTDHEF